MIAIPLPNYHLFATTAQDKEDKLHRKIATDENKH